MTMTAIHWSVFAFFVGALAVWLAREKEATALRTSVAEERLCIVELLTKLCRCEANLSELRAALSAASERVAALLQIERRGSQ
ncbi:MAG: hypothetical protein WB810_03815 [Candidatus Cybelea sp.]